MLLNMQEDRLIDVQLDDQQEGRRSMLDAAPGACRFCEKGSRRGYVLVAYLRVISLFYQGKVCVLEVVGSECFPSSAKNRGPRKEVRLEDYRLAPCQGWGDGDHVQVDNTRGTPRLRF